MAPLLQLGRLLLSPRRAFHAPAPLPGRPASRRLRLVEPLSPAPEGPRRAWTPADYAALDRRRRRAQIVARRFLDAPRPADVA